MAASLRWRPDQKAAPATGSEPGPKSLLMLDARNNIRQRPKRATRQIVPRHAGPHAHPPARNFSRPPPRWPRGGSAAAGAAGGAGVGAPHGGHALPLNLSLGAHLRALPGCGRAPHPGPRASARRKFFDCPAGQFGRRPASIHLVAASNHCLLTASSARLTISRHSSASKR